MAKKKTTNAFEYLRDNGKLEGCPEFKIKPYLTLTEEMQFVDTVVNGVLVDGEYTPVSRRIAQEYALVAYYTDIPLPDMSEENDETVAAMEDLNKILLTTTLKAKISSVINLEQVKNMDEAIEAEIQMRLNASNKPESVASVVDDYLLRVELALRAWWNKYSANLPQLTALAKKLSTLDDKQLIAEITRIAKENKV